MIATTKATVLFVVFVVITYVRMFRTVKRESNQDTPV